MSSKPKQTTQQRELERMSIEREKQLRVEQARQTTKAFSDNVAFRKKLRGIFSLLSNGFKGFPGTLGVAGPGRGGSGVPGGGGASSAGAVNGGGTTMGTGVGGGAAEASTPRSGPTGDRFVRPKRPYR